MVGMSAILYGGITAGGDFLLSVGLSVYELSVYTLFFLLISILPVIIIKRELLFQRSLLSFYLVYGFIGAVLQLSSISALVLGVPVAILAMLLNTQPIWTTIIGHFYLKEKVSRKHVFAIMLALAGVVVLLEPWHTDKLGHIPGIILSLLGGLSLSLWIVWGRKGGLNRQHAITITFGYILFSLTSLLILYPFVTLITSNEMITGFSLSIPSVGWKFLAIYALLVNLLPHLLFFTGIKMVKAVTAGLLLLLEPVSATLIATFIFKQELTTYIVIGGALILLSNYFVIKRD